MRKPIKNIDGIPFFSEDRYWGKSSSRELENAINIIENNGWNEFFIKFKDKFDYTFEENRADWRFVVPIRNNFSVLDIGAGMGRISIPLARVVNKVIAIDQSFLRMKFLKLRAKKEELKNIDVFVCNIFDQPFSAESFDLIVMNGLLEWVGATDQYKNPREAQIVSLQICKKLLKPGGYLYIGIENRFAASYLRGIDHSGLRFTSFFPRVIANIYVKLYKGKNERYDTYTYSKYGYDKLLHEAGFSKIDFYLPYPGYNMPKIMIPYENLNAMTYAIRNLLLSDSRKKRLIRWLADYLSIVWFYRYIFFSFGIVVKK